MTRDKNILLLENTYKQKPEGFDHVFSFVPNRADSFPEQYFSMQEEENIQSEVHDQVISFLEWARTQIVFSYKEIDLFSCFKKIISNYSVFIKTRHQILKHVLNEKKPTRVIFDSFEGHPFYPGAFLIFKNSELAAEYDYSLVELQNREKPIKEKSRNVFQSLKLFVPSYLKKGRIEHSEAVVFSDFSKFNSLLNFISPEKVTYYSDSKSPIIWKKSFKFSFNYYQKSFHGFSRIKYLQLKNRYLKTILESGIFSNLNIPGIKSEALFKPFMTALLNSQLPKLLFDIDSAFHFFARSVRSKTVLVDEDIAPVKNAFCQIANMHDVGTYVSCHGNLGKKSGYLPLTANRIFVWGAAQKQKLVDWGCESNRIVISGSNRYFNYIRMDQNIVRKNICDRYGFDPSKKIIVIGFMISRQLRRRVFENYRKKILLELLDTISKMEDVQCIIKAKNHIDHNKNIAEEWISSRNLQSRFVVDAKVDPYLLILSSDLVISHNSTFAIDGIALSKPVVLLYNEKREVFKEFDKSNVFFEANNPIDAEQLIKAVLEGQIDAKGYQENYIREHFCQSENSPEIIMKEHLFLKESKELISEMDKSL